MITNYLKKVKKNHQGSFFLLRAHGIGGASATPFFKYVPPPAERFFKAKPKQAGKKEGGWGEGIFARPPVFGGWVCVAEGDAQVSQRQDFVQNRFALRSVIATIQNLTIFQDEKIACSPRLRLGFARKFPYISARNQTAGQNQKSVFYPVGGGSGAQSARSKNIPLEKILKCFCFPIFSFPLSAEYEASFSTPRFTCPPLADRQRRLLKLRSKNL